MKKLLFLPIVFLLQQHLYSQREIVAKVEFYKSKASEFIFRRDAEDTFIKNLNKRKSKVQIIQGDHITKLETDAKGIFRIQTTSKDSIQIIINDHSPVFDGRFKFDYNEIKDTLKLRISDKKAAVHLDANYDPDFYQKYNEQQAEIDFKNGKHVILIIFYDWLTPETINRKKRIIENYGVNYKHIFCSNKSQIRIMIRYNQVIKKLVGIKEKLWYQYL